MAKLAYKAVIKLKASAEKTPSIGLINTVISIVPAEEGKKYIAYGHSISESNFPNTAIITTIKL